MKLYRAAQLRWADSQAAAAGVPTLLLMESAGRAVADSVSREYGAAAAVAVLCGPGNNGGDGYVVARHLHLAGWAVTVLELSSRPTSEDSRTARAALLAHLQVAPLHSEALRQALGRADVVVDALFGSGLNRPLAGDLAEVVDLLNSDRTPVVSVDVPSGIDSDSPVSTGHFIVADRTVQLAGPVVAGAFEPSRSAFGRQELVAIGIPEAILEQASPVRLLGAAEVESPRRPGDLHKYRAGTVLVVAGSNRYLGAAELACRGAYRVGAGLVTLAAEGRLPAGWPEIVFEPVDWSQSPLDRLAAVDERRSQAVVAGPGLDDRAIPYLPQLIASRAAPWVLDAGALEPNEGLQDAVRAHGGCVLTPHGGEAARLLAATSSEIESDPLRAATRIASDWNAVCVLKGSSTVVARPSGEVAVSPFGHSGMATGGTGDVLAGVIGAFMAAPGATPNRVEAAVVTHGLAGQLCGEALGAGMLASDLVEHLPAALKSISESSVIGFRP